MTLRQISRALNLSVTTVSRALAGYSDVAPQTRKRIEAEAARIGYRPNETARRLRSGRVGAVGVVLPATQGHFGDPFFLRMLAAIGPRLAASGLDLLVSAAPAGEDELAVYRRLVEGQRVDGLIVFRTRMRDARIDYLLAAGTPFVAHGRANAARPFAHLDIDGEDAFRIASERLIAFGHRRIALVNAAEVYSFAHHRARGWRRALAEAGYEPGTMLEGEPTEANGYRLAAQLLQGPTPPTALLCGTDRLAVGALHAISAAGLRAGRDISVIGYDNLPMACYTEPPLTTMEQPIEAAATRLVEILLAQFAGADPADFSELWPAALVPRQSDGPAPAAAASVGKARSVRAPVGVAAPHE